MSMVRYLVRQLGEKFSTKYVIDIGSSSGVPTDPCFPYITNPNFSGFIKKRLNSHTGRRLDEKPREMLSPFR